MATSTSIQAPAGPVKPRLRTPGPPPWAIGILGVVGIIAGWWLAAATILRDVGRPPGGATGAIPTPGAIVSGMLTDGFGFYGRNAGVTLAEAGQGYLLGCGIALALAATVLLIPRLETLIVQLGVISYCIPLVAIGPIIFIVLGAPKSGEPSGTAVALAALSVFFTTLVSSVAGFRSADRAGLEVIRVAGGRRIHELLMVQLISAVPHILSALKIAAPAALLGAVLGEYVGGVDRGLGPAMVNAQQSMEIPRVWAVAIVSGLLAFGAYLVLELIGRPLSRRLSDGKEAG